MKTAFATIVLFIAATSAVAVPEKEGWYIRRADEVGSENLPIVELSVTNDLFPGVTFTGTAESIYHEMKALNPAAVGNVSTVEERSLEKRSTFNCNWGSRIPTWNNCIEGVGYLQNLGTSRCGVNAAPACARVSCSHSCGIYLCNKLSSSLWVYCGDIAHDVNAIATNCDHGGDANLLVHGARDFDSHFIGLGGDSC